MAKFDLFNPTTWHAAPVDVEALITNKAVGAIGQKVNELRELKERLLRANKQQKNSDYDIVTALKNSNPDAYECMGIRIAYPADAIGTLMTDIDFILNAWNRKRQDERRQIWRSLVPVFERIKPYLDGNRGDYYDRRQGQEALEAVCTIKVEGNPAWDVYLAEVKRNLQANELISHLTEKLRTCKTQLAEDAFPEYNSGDSTDDVCSSDDDPPNSRTYRD